MNSEQILQALLSLPGMSGPRVSPDGAWVAWTWSRVGPLTNVYVAPADGSAPPTQLTEGDQDLFLVAWTPDSRALLVAHDQDGDERYRLFRVELDRPGERVLLTDAEPHYFLRGSQLHPNGRWLVYGANYDFATDREIEPTCIYRHDLETSERLLLARPEKAAFTSPSLNVPGTHVLYVRMDRNPAGRQIWLVDIEGERDREILNFGDDVKVSASWFPDGRRVLVLAETGAHRRLGIWDRETEALRWVVDDPTRNLESAYVPLRSERVVVLEVRDARTRASLLDVDSSLETPVTREDGDLIPLAPVDGGAWVGIHSSARQPADAVRFRLEEASGELTSLTRVWERTALLPGLLARAEDYRWRSTDGLEIQGWLYRPTTPARGTVVYIHGGPTAHSADRLNNLIQFLVFQGFNVLDPNYRGSTGFSLGFREAIKEDGWGGREQDDIAAGIQTLLADGVAEPGRVGVTGTSYGGYSSWCLITRCPPELVAASAPVCGMTDLVVDYETTRPDLRPYSEEMMGGSPEQVPERYRRGSPIHFVGNIRGRLLIVQGMQDPNVSPENVRAVQAELDQAGISYDLLAFEDEGHGILRPKNQQVLYTRLAEFFGQAFAGSG